MFSPPPVALGWQTSPRGAHFQFGRPYLRAVLQATGELFLRRSGVAAFATLNLAPPGNRRPFRFHLPQPSRRFETVHRPDLLHLTAHPIDKRPADGALPTFWFS